MSKAKQFPHYFKSTEHLDEVDVYQVLQIFDPQDPSTALGHAIKKILLPGGRGSKGRKQDIEEAIASLQRFIEINYPLASPAHHEVVKEDLSDDEIIKYNLSLGEGETPSPFSNDDSFDPNIQVSYRYPTGSDNFKDHTLRQQGFMSAAKDAIRFYFKVLLPAKKAQEDISANYLEERERIHSLMMERARKAKAKQ